MKKFFYSMMTVALMVGLSLSGIACSDSNKDENGSGGNNGDEPQIENEQEELGWHLVAQLTDEGSAPAGWIGWQPRRLLRGDVGLQLFG